MRSGSFARLATVTATTQREAAPAGGLAGAMANNVVNFKCTPLDPYRPSGAIKIGDTFKGKALGAFAELLITYAEDGLDILENDTLITGGVTYRIRAVGQWHWAPTLTNTLAILLEEIK